MGQTTKRLCSNSCKQHLRAQWLFGWHIQKHLLEEHASACVKRTFLAAGAFLGLGSAAFLGAAAFLGVAAFFAAAGFAAFGLVACMHRHPRSINILQPLSLLPSVIHASAQPTKAILPAPLAAAVRMLYKAPDMQAWCRL